MLELKVLMIFFLYSEKKYNMQLWKNITKYAFIKKKCHLICIYE